MMMMRTKNDADDGDGDGDDEDGVLDLGNTTFLNSLRNLQKLVEFSLGSVTCFQGPH